MAGKDPKAQAWILQNRKWWPCLPKNGRGGPGIDYELKTTENPYVLTNVYKLLSLTYYTAETLVYQTF